MPAHSAVPRGAARGRGRLMNDPECNQCKKTDRDTVLRKCPVCYKYFCDEHAHLMGGRTFCSSMCADFFFFSDSDE